MLDDQTIFLAISFTLVALLYSAVGQAGASGYLAAMALLDMAPASMKITALSLNLLVASIGTFQFWRAGHMSLRTFYPFAVLGFPFSLIGGSLHLSAAIYYPVVGVILLLAAVQMLRSALGRSAGANPTPSKPPFMPALLIGAAIGFVSGVTGTGGGIFLAPVILAMGWVSPRRTAAVTAAYNLLNSAAALTGSYSILESTPAALPVWLVAVAAGGIVGSFIGSRLLPENALRYTLAAVLFVSGAKLIAS